MKIYTIIACLFLLSSCLSDRGAYLYSKYVEDTLYGTHPNQQKAKDGTILGNKRQLKWYESLSEEDKQRKKTGEKYCANYAYEESKKSPEYITYHKNEEQYLKQHTAHMEIRKWESVRNQLYEQCLVDNKIPRYGTSY